MSEYAPMKDEDRSESTRVCGNCKYSSNDINGRGDIGLICVAYDCHWMSFHEGTKNAKKCNDFVWYDLKEGDKRNNIGLISKEK